MLDISGGGMGPWMKSFPNPLIGGNVMIIRGMSVLVTAGNSQLLVFGPLPPKTLLERLRLNGGLEGGTDATLRIGMFNRRPADANEFALCTDFVTETMNLSTGVAMAIVSLSQDFPISAQIHDKRYVGVFIDGPSTNVIGNLFIDVRLPRKSLE